MWGYYSPAKASLSTQQELEYCPDLLRSFCLTLLYPNQHLNLLISLEGLTTFFLFFGLTTSNGSLEFAFEVLNSKTKDPEMFAVWQADCSSLVPGSHT